MDRREKSRNLSILHEAEEEARYGTRMNQSKQNVLVLPANRVGRDYIIGDICGAFDLVYQAMRENDFNPERDRLFSLGHLIHPDGPLTDCIRFLRHPSVFAVRSNGEQQLLDLFEEGEPDDACVEALATLDFHGLGWLAGTGHAQRRQLVEAMRMLPLAITVGEHEVGLVHAGVPAGTTWKEFSVGLCKGDEEFIQVALHGTMGVKPDLVPDVGNVFVCYTPEWDGMHENTNVTAVLPDPVLLPLQVAVTEAELTKGCVDL